MKKMLIILMLAGCKLINPSNEKQTQNNSIIAGNTVSTPVSTQRPSAQTPPASLPIQRPNVPSNQELWISNLQNSDAYYWKGSDNSLNKVTILDNGKFSVNSGSVERDYYLMSVNSPTQALYALSLRAGEHSEQFSVLLDIKDILPNESFHGNFEKVLVLTYTNNTVNGHIIDGQQTDVLYLNPLRK